MSIAAMNWAWQLRLKPTVKFVLMALADAADDQGECWPSVPTIARKTCMDERSVQRILKILGEKQLLLVEARFRNDGSHTSNKYRLVMTETGDNLSPPERQAIHEVVTPSTLGGGKNDTQTTNEPPVNLKPQQQNKREDAKLIYPNKLKAEEQASADTLLSTVDNNRAQELLDELAARLNNNSVRNPLGYLRSLVQRNEAGKFIPELGLNVARARKRKQEEANKKQPVVNRTKPEDILKKLSSMHAVLKPKNKTEGQTHHE